MKSHATTRPRVTIVVPVFNESENIQALYAHLTAVIDPLPYVFDLLFVDDGSRDTTLDRIRSLANEDPRVKGLSFSRNFGHQAALIAGLEAAQGDAVITMDGDLQHPPRLIPDLLAQWRLGYDIVYTVRRETENASALKLGTARIFYALMNRIGNVNIPANSADFRLLGRPVVDQLNRMEERALFLRGLVQWVGFRQTSLTYDAERRFAGRTKYSLRRMLSFAVDGITSFSTAPLTFSLYFGLIVSLLSFLYGLFAIYTRLFTSDTLPGWTSILVTVLFLGGIQLITIGVIGLYLGKLYQEVKQRPRYIIQSVIEGASKRRSRA